MKIFLDNVNLNSNSGPNSFGQRISKQFKEMGHEIVPYGEDNDIHLTFIQPSVLPNSSSKSVLRLDGIWFKPEEFDHNEPIKAAYLSYDEVIVQSEFDKEMITKWFGERDNVHVIHNGIDLSHQDRRLNPLFVNKDDGELMFVCSSNWHKQKRLKDNIRLFQQIRDNTSKRAVLFIFGNLPVHLHNEITKDWTREDSAGIYFLGNRTHQECLWAYQAADYMIHLAWLDHCPNVVVEALSQGCPVICTDSGGTKEIVKDNGIVIPETTQYNYELLDYDKPYELDFSNFELPEERPKVDASHLDIAKVAEKYIEVFK